MRFNFQRYLLWLPLLLGCRCAGEPVLEISPELSMTVAATVPLEQDPVSAIIGYTAEASAEQTLPMLVLIHGYGGRPEKMLQTFSRVGIPARVVALRGESIPPKGFYWFPIDQVDPDVDQLAIDLRAVSTEVAEDIERLTVEFPTHGKPVVAGFSQGGMIAFELGMRHSDSVGSTIVLSGYYPEPLFPTERAGEAQVPMFAIHGTEDEVLPLKYMDLALTHVNKLGYDVEHREYEGMSHAIEGPAYRHALKPMERQLRRQGTL